MSENRQSFWSSKGKNVSHHPAKFHTVLEKSEQDYVIQNILRFIGKQKSLITNIENKKQLGFQNIF